MPSTPSIPRASASKARQAAPSLSVFLSGLAALALGASGVVHLLAGAGSTRTAGTWAERAIHSIAPSDLRNNRIADLAGIGRIFGGGGDTSPVDDTLKSRNRRRAGTVSRAGL